MALNLEIPCEFPGIGLLLYEYGYCLSPLLVTQELAIVLLLRSFSDQQHERGLRVLVSAHADCYHSTILMRNAILNSPTNFGGDLISCISLTSIEHLSPLLQ